MDVNINLGVARNVTLNEIVAAPEVVRLCFTSEVYPLPELLVLAKRGDEVLRFKTRGGETIDVSALFTSAGAVELEVALILRGEAAKRWCVEGFTVKEINGEFVAIPEVARLAEELADVKQELAATRQALAELTLLAQNNNVI